MFYNKVINNVLNFVYEAHKGVWDKSGVPYVFHPFYVASRFETEDEVALSLLHDIVEDTDYTFEDIEKLGVSSAVIEGLKLLTHDDSVPYFEYVEKIKTNPLAKAVKLADLEHNSTLSRMETVTEKDLKRLEKYKKAKEILLS